MAWNEQDSKRRVDENDFHDLDVNVADLAKTMDFANLGLKDVRRADAAHIYVDVPNFHRSVADAGADKQKQKKLVRAASVLRKLQTELLKASDIVGDDEVGRVQLQAARLHALCFKPYGDVAKRARHSVAMGITMNTYVYGVFNEVFEDLSRSFESAVGISAGKSLIANLGFRGERERICLGTPANLAAKALGPGGSITITPEVWEQLPSLVQSQFAKQEQKIGGSDVYRATGLRWDTHPAIAAALGVTWKAEKWKKRTEERRDELTLESMEVAWAEVLIDVESLSERNSRRTDAIGIYADLDGFTAYVQDAETDDKVVSLVRELHMIRREFHVVLGEDYPGLVLQHQGDRVFAILHVPCGDEESEHKRRCRKAVDAAIGVQSSMQHVLRNKLSNKTTLDVSVGVDVGIALVTRLGTKGKREAVCVGPGVDAAEDLQLGAAGKEIWISEAVFDTLDREEVREAFVRRNGAYVATDLTFPKIDQKEIAKAAKKGTLGARVLGNRIETVPNAAGTSKPWVR